MTPGVFALETSINYRYQVMQDKDGNGVFSLLPVFLVKADIDPSNVGKTAGEIAGNLSTWKNTTKAESPEASLSFVLTILSTTIASNDGPLPLVQFPGLVIPVPFNDAEWW